MNSAVEATPVICAAQEQRRQPHCGRRHASLGKVKEPARSPSTAL